MELREAAILAENLISKFKLEGYEFRFNEVSLNYFGWCNNDKKIISLSSQLTELNPEEKVRQTILHEIAHALTPGCAHNEIWRRVCLAIGGDGKRCYDEKTTETPVHKWVAKCGKCGKETPRHRKNKRLYCGKCLKENGHRFIKEIKLKWIKNI